MKASLILLGAAALICLAHAVHEHVPSHVADKHYLMKQKLIYELFWHIDQPTLYHPELYQKARSYSIEDNIDSYTDKDVVMEFLHHWKHSMLPRGHVFSMAYPHLEEEAICLFKLLYVAKDFDTFYNTAVWARFRVNEQMYVYALTVAVIHRPDTRHIHIPPLYEVLPHLFFNDDVINHAYRIGMGDTSMRKVMGGMDTHVIHANYSHWYMILDDVPENKLSYYTEDVGLNYFYFMVTHDYPYWMKSVDYHLDKEIRGELYFFVHKQLLARYNLERLSNDMGEIDFVDYTKPVVHGHYPNMHYHNGLPVPHRVRHDEVPVHMHDIVMELREWESRVHHAIDVGYVVDHTGKHVDIYTREGLNILGNLIQGNADSVNHRYYGHMDRRYKKVLGHSPMPTTKYNVVPSAMEIHVMNMRDHIFYSMYKNIVSYWMKYKSHLPSYTHEELVFPGVKIESVTVDKLTTFFDTFESMISNAISIRNHKDAQAMIIKARQMRLNHKPFTYHITVHSDKDTKAMVRVFLGPKYDVHGHEMHLDESHMHFVEMDQWVVDLKVGTNKIERGSHESFYGMPDIPSSEVLYKKMVKAMEGGETYTYSHQLYGFPDRLLLPKGKREGMPFRLFVFVSHFDELKSYKMDSPVWGTGVVDHHAIGFPLDRHIHPHNFTVPNMHLKDVMIYHKHADELNIPQ